MQTRRLLLSIVACGGICAAAPGQSARPIPERAQYFQTRFDERHPLGQIAEQRKRFKWSKKLIADNDPQKGDYDIADESFWAYVPSTYREDVPHGLLVWVSPGGEGRIPAAWPEVLEKHKLIAVGADGSGNDRLVWYRIGLALDAVHNARAKWKLDEERIYVTGFSGGGRVATRLGMVYADVFDGGIYQGGSGFWAKIKVPGDPKRAWQPRFPKPRSKVLRAAKRESRHVLFAGSDDPNRTQSVAIYDRLEREGFKRVTWLEQPGVAHTTADAEWMSKAVEALDAPLREAEAKAQAKQKKGAAAGKQR